jgi:hypothetical protein
MAARGCFSTSSLTATSRRCCSLTRLPKQSSSQSSNSV